jgi:hypothetical protein
MYLNKNKLSKYVNGEQSTCLQTGLENGFNVEAQIHLEKQRETYTSIVLQWALPL